MIDPRGHKVSIVLHKFDRGGSALVAAYLARGFADRGMDVELVLFTDQGEIEAIARGIIGPDIPVHFLGSRNGPRALDLALGLAALTRHLKARSPDAIIAAANHVALVTARAYHRAGRPGRLFLKTTNPIASSRHRGPLKALRRWTYRRIFPDAAAIWTLSEDESAEMRDSFPQFAAKFRAVANPYVTPTMLAPVVPGPRSRTILGVGRLTAQKRFERLIEAFALVEDDGLTLTILGEGEDRPQLEALVARLGLQDRVSLPGHVTSVAAAYRDAQMFVLTSDYEGLPAVVLEAMAANLPVLATDCFPAARSIVAGAEGCAIIERTDPASLAALIERHLDQPRPTTLRAVAERYSIANGIASHAQALLAD